MKISNSEWVIALHDNSSAVLSNEVFVDFDRVIRNVLSEFHVEATHFAAEGQGFSGRAQRLDGRTYQKLKDKKFSGLSVLSLMSVHPKSDAPTYDRLVSASISKPSANDKLLVFAANDGVTEFGKAGFENVLVSLVDMYQWTTGYAFIDQVQNQPEFHALGLDTGELSEQELESLTRWYVSSPDERLRRIRSVYPYNLLNEMQLSRRIAPGVTLREYILAESGDLQRVDSLFLWKVRIEEVRVVRKELRGTEAVISS